MAGNHSKKSVERKDSYKQQQRKNLSNNVTTSTKKENKSSSFLNNTKAQQAAGAAILSAVTSPQASNLIQQQPPSVGVNGFNRGEIIEFLNMRFSDALTAYHDTNLDPSVRPEKYESNKSTAWNKDAPFVWGQQSKGAGTTLPIGTMANGTDFLTELFNQSTTIQ
ncbi:uncharacterized protein BX663DRAFT_526399 [Cokeromyces recurvatus]|uniref:uncharacterized protein n=1 Tax=Cokeromyces recurvatus TaxID=90255 RepID=UPI00221E4B59|nr:uncharacterized protein BX663DRAFT_526399 [Cokeromyces recurvatus]KAI7898033.1 hypothetical protein BX663DRAFT_526399 [Cokeromyces recurvatus]